MVVSYSGRIKIIILPFICTCLLPLLGLSISEEMVYEKRIGVAMRMIGHEVLTNLGDLDSRVLPIEKVDNQYKISFEHEFGFNPEHLATIIKPIMAKTGVASHYWVEVQQCETREMVYSFEIGNASFVPCQGRIMPKDCYDLLITIMDTSYLSENFYSASNNGQPLPFKETRRLSFFTSPLMIVPLLFLVGLIGYILKTRNDEMKDEHHIPIGAFIFDKRNMTLSCQDRNVELSKKESELLSVLHDSANVPLNRDVILEKVWGDEGHYVGRTLDVFISKLRKKLDGDDRVKIVNIRGIGYKLVMD